MLKGFRYYEQHQQADGTLIRDTILLVVCAEAEENSWSIGWKLLRQQKLPLDDDWYDIHRYENILPFLVE